MIQGTKPTISFGILFLLALGLVGAVYYLSQQIHDELQLSTVPQHKIVAKIPANVSSPLTAQPVSTTNWQNYSDPTYLVSFKYPDNWHVKVFNENDFDVIVLMPTDGQDHIRIYVSPSDFIGIAGLQTSPTTVGGIKGVSANGMVIGVKNGPDYFTFDAGQDQHLIPEFKGIMQTVAFNK